MSTLTTQPAWDETERRCFSKTPSTIKKWTLKKKWEDPYPLTCFVFDRIMYWTDWGYHAKIERADMSGQQRVVLVNTSLSWPNGLTLDQERNRLYWVDASYDKLEYLHLSTNTRVTLIDSSATLPHPFGLTLLGDYLYWTDWSDYTVKRANKESATDITVFVTAIGQPMDIHGYNLSETTIPSKYKEFAMRRNYCYIKHPLNIFVREINMQRWWLTPSTSTV